MGIQIYGNFSNVFINILTITILCLYIGRHGRRRVTSTRPPFPSLSSSSLVAAARCSASPSLAVHHSPPSVTHCRPSPAPVTRRRPSPVVRRHLSLAAVRRSPSPVARHPSLVVVASLSPAVVCRPLSSVACCRPPLAFAVVRRSPSVAHRHPSSPVIAIARRCRCTSRPRRGYHPRPQSPSSVVTPIVALAAVIVVGCEKSRKCRIDLRATSHKSVQTPTEMPRWHVMAPRSLTHHTANNCPLSTTTTTASPAKGEYPPSGPAATLPSEFLLAWPEGSNAVTPPVSPNSPHFSYRARAAE